jgi:hypothetical protein
MNPIVRRSSFYYLTSAVTYLAIMGRYLVTRDWSAFEIIPLFMPIWMLSALLASESDERYAFLRTLPVRDADVVTAKVVLILGAAAFPWTLMTMAAVVRMPDGAAAPATLVYLSLIAVAGLWTTLAYQIAIWRFGFAAMRFVIVATIVAAILLVLAHLASLKNVDTWPVLSELGFIGWLGRAPWISSLVLGVLALIGVRALARVGVRVKAASEAHL